MTIINYISRRKLYSLKEFFQAVYDYIKNILIFDLVTLSINYCKDLVRKDLTMIHPPPPQKNQNK